MTELRGGIHLIDLVYSGLDKTMASYLIKGEDGAFMLIETGPYALLPQLEAGIRALGLDPENLTDILLTHIHLDHSGNAGALAQRYGATVWVHEGGAAFLTDPERLISSSRRVYGDSFDELMKGAEPLPEQHLIEIQDGDEFELHGHDFRVVHTPGHAGSHVSFLMDGRDLFTGDSAGIRFPGTPIVKPATAPPEIDLDAWLNSIARMQALNPERLLLTHFGEVTDVNRHFRELRRQNALWGRAILDGLNLGDDDGQLVERITEVAERQMSEADLSQLDRERYRVSSNHTMTAAGLARYWRKLQPGRLEETRFPLDRPARLAVLASGRGSNFAALAQAYPQGDPLASVELLVSDKAAAGAFGIAARYDISAEHVPFSNRESFEAELELLLSEQHIDLICLAGFMRLLSPGFVQRWQGRLLNIHPSLLPEFPGLNPQQQALDAQVTETGCSVHFVDAGMDTGAVISQARVEITADDDADSLAERIRQQEHTLYPQAVRAVLRGTAT